MSEFNKVKEFSEIVAKSQNAKLPDSPQKLSKDNIMFVVKMIMSECQELIGTIAHDEVEQKIMLQQCLDKIDWSKTPRCYLDDVDMVTNQCDALVDMMYYIGDTGARFNLPLADVFNEVHNSNMNKRKSNGLFSIRDDGKVLKPADWVPPNVDSIIRKSVLKINN